jgi:hypothetical protein
MAEMKYHVVKNDKNEMMLVYWGSERPSDVPKDETEIRQRAFRERWLPAGWTVVASYNDEAEANKNVRERISKGKASLADEKLSTPKD